MIMVQVDDCLILCVMWKTVGVEHPFFKEMSESNWKFCFCLNVSFAPEFKIQLEIDFEQYLVQRRGKYVPTECQLLPG